MKDNDRDGSLWSGRSLHTNTHHPPFHHRHHPHVPIRGRHTEGARHNHNNAIFFSNHGHTHTHTHAHRHADACLAARLLQAVADGDIKRNCGDGLRVPTLSQLISLTLSDHALLLFSSFPSRFSSLFTPSPHSPLSIPHQFSQKTPHVSCFSFTAALIDLCH